MASTYISRSTTSGTDTIWTWSGWIKRSKLGTSQTFFGTGNARALASGITKATLPTMTGMAISIVGLLTFTVLYGKSQTLISKL